MKPTLISTIALVALLLIIFNTSEANTYYWNANGSSSNYNWSTPGNWHISSGTPMSAPSTGDSVVFTMSYSTYHCIIDGSVSVLSIRLDGSYDSTVSQSSGNSVTATYAKFTGGTFVGSNASITFSSLTINGGTFTTTSGITTLKGNFYFTSGTFNHNNGRVVFYNSLTISGSSSPTFYDAVFQAVAGNTTVTLSNSITVSDSTLLTGSNQLFINSSNSSVINASGEVKDYNTSGTGGGTATIVVNGSSTQHITGNATTEDVGKLPNLTINSTGTVNLVGFITMGGSTTLTYTSGTVNAGSSDVVFYYDNNINGSMTFSNVEFQGTLSTFTVSNTITVNGNVTTSGTGYEIINTGTVNIYGSLYINNSSSYTSGNTAVLNFVGSDNDSIIASSSFTIGQDQGLLPKVTIAKSGGILYLSGIISVQNTWTNNYSETNINPGTSTVDFVSTSSGSLSIGGSYATPLWNLRFGSSGYDCTYTFTADSALSIHGLTTFGGATNNFTFSGNSINLYGSLSILNTGGILGGNTVFNFVGSANDSIISSVGLNEGLLPQVTIAKTGGSLSLFGIISVQNNWTNNYSRTNIIPGTSILEFLASSSGSLSIGGSYTTPLWDVHFGGDNNCTYSFTADSALSIHGLTTIGGWGDDNFTFSGNSINLYGSLKNINTASGGGGNTVFNFVGSANDSIIDSSNVTLNEGLLPQVTIAKTGGTLSLFGIITEQNTWTNNYSENNINPGTSTLEFASPSSGSLSIGGSHTTPLWNVRFGGSYDCTYTFTADSTLSVHGLTTIGGTTNYFIFNGNSINLYGSLSLLNESETGGGSSVFNFVGSANDSIISPSGYPINEYYLPCVYVKKTGGALSLIGNITSGANWTYKQGIVNSGTSYVVFQGINSISTSYSSNSMSFNNLRIGGTSIATLGSVLNVGGTLTINGSLSTSSSNYQINIGDSWVNNGTYTGNNSNVTFNGSIADSIEGSNNTSFYSLTLNKTGTLTLADPTTVTNALTLTSGDMLTSSTDLLTLNNGSSVSGANDNSFVNGPVKKVGNSAFTFPTGSDNSYHPIGISAPSSTSDAFTAQYSHSAPGDRTSTDDSLTFVSSCDYWLLSHPAGSSNVTVSLGWGTNSCNIERLSSLRVGYFNTSGSKWTNLGQSTTTGSTASGSVTATTASSISTTADTFAISKHSPTPSVSAGSNVTICYGTSTNLSATASDGLSPYTYSWSPSIGLSSTTVYNPTASPTAATTYTVTVNDDDNAPTTIATVVVTVNPLPTVTASASPSTICAYSNSTLVAGGALTYTWYPATGLGETTGSSITTTLAATTTYTITGTDVNGCVNTTTEVIIVNSIPTVTVSASPSTICYNTSSTLTTGGALTYTWSPSTGLSATSGSSVTSTLISTTTYTISGTGSNGCVNTATETITVNPLPTITVSASPSIICYGGNSTLTASGAATYTWSPITGLNATTGSSGTATLTAATTYTVSGTDTNGCSNTSAVAIAIHPQLFANAGYTHMGITSNDTLGGSPAASGGTSPYSYSWETSNDSVISTINDPIVSPSITSTYYLTVSDSLGCIAQDTATIIFLPAYSPEDTDSSSNQYADPESYMALSDTSYNTIVKIDDAYFKNHPDTDEDGLEATYNQWKHFWSQHLHPNSNGNPSFDYAEQAMYNFYSNQSCDANGASADWMCIGPFLNGTANEGRVSAIWVDTSDENHILIGTPTGSVWRTTNGLATSPTWECITDGSGLPALGISDITVDPDNTNIIYIATGLFESYSFGVCYTYNGNCPASSVKWYIDQDFYQNVLNLNSSTPTESLSVPEIKFQAHTDNVFATVSGVQVSGSSVKGLLYWKNAANATNPWEPITLPVPANPSGTGTPFVPQWWKLDDIEFDPSNHQTIFVTGEDPSGFSNGVPVWASQDGGSSWQTFLNGTENDYDVKVSFATTNTTDHVDILYNAIFSYNYTLTEYNVDNNPSSPTILPLTSQEYDLGLVTALSSGPWGETSFDPVFSVIPDDNTPTNNLFFGVWNYVYSTNGALSSLTGCTDDFVEGVNGLRTHVDIRRLYRYCENRGTPIEKYIYYLGTDGGIIRNDPSTDPCTFTCLNGSGLAINQFADLSVSGLFNNNFVVGGCIDDNTYTGIGTSWAEIIGGYGGDNFNSTTSPILNANQIQSMVGGGEGGDDYPGLNSVLTSPTNSLSVSGFSSITNQGYNESVPIHYHPVTGDLYGGSDIVYESAGGTGSWVDISSGFTNESILAGIQFGNPKVYEYPPQVQEFNVNYTDPKIVYVAYDNRYGDNTQQLFVIDRDDPTELTVNYINIPGWSSGLDEYITDVISDPLNPGRIWVSFGGFYGTTPIKNKVILFNCDPTTGIIISDTDISAGLPDFPINNLDYQLGSNDIIYAATDVGVYYWNKYNNSWYCYSQNLSPALYINTDINYCTGNIFASSYGRGIWESPMIPTHEFGSHPITPTTYDWSTSQTVYCDVEVQPGYTLSISGSTTTINMENDAAIIVDRGARLVVDGATITNNSCETMWEGIQVLGNSNADQSISDGMPVNQGMVVVENGAKIENAYVGILADNAVYTTPDFAFPNGSGSEGGGIVNVSHSTFLNDRFDIILDPYSYTATSEDEPSNKSEIELSTFECNSTLNSPYVNVGTSEFILLWDVHGVQILGNSFSGNSVLGVTGEGIGIFSADADYTVNEYCDPGIYPCYGAVVNSFNNLYYGILSVVGNPENVVHPISIQNNTFDYTDRCIYLSGYQNTPNISNNYMKIDVPGDTTYGLYLSACNGYNVVGNTITLPSSTFGFSPATLNYGMIIRNSNYFDYSTGAPVPTVWGTDVDNEINNNTFDYLQYGSISFGDNANNNKFPGNNGQYGLEFLCNQYTNVQYGIGAYPDYPYNNSAQLMKSSQGSPTNPANNSFSDDAYNLYNTYQYPAIDYYYYGGTTSNPYDPGTNIVGFNIYSTTNNNSCSIGSGSGGISSLISSDVASISGFITTKGTFGSKIDGGNQAYLLSTIANTLEIASDSLRSALLLAGPYLSDTVLNAMIDRSTPMVDSDIVAVAINNSPLDSAVYRNLFNTFFAGELPEPVVELRSSVEAAQSGVSPRDTLYADISEDISQQSYIVQNLGNLYSIGVDSGIMTIDSIINFYTRYNMPTKALNYILYEDDTTSARALIDTLPTTDSVESSFKNYYKLLLSIKETDSMAYTLDSSQLAQVNSIASQQTYAGFMALNLLSTLSKVPYHEQFPMVIDSGSSMVDRMTLTNNNNNRTTQNIVIGVAPNPAKDEVTLSFGLLAGKQGLLTIYNTLGEVIFQQSSTSFNSTMTINTSNWSQGIYEIRLIMSNGNTYKDKLAIINR